jgi:hypothetical protein
MRGILDTNIFTAFRKGAVNERETFPGERAPQLRTKHSFGLRPPSRPILRNLGTNRARERYRDDLWPGNSSQTEVRG